MAVLCGERLRSCGLRGRTRLPHRPPVPGHQEGGPVVGVAVVGIGGLGEEGELGPLQGLGPPLTVKHQAVVIPHEGGGGFIVYLPETHQLGLRPGEHQGPAQTVDPLPRAYRPDPGVTGREDDQARAAEIEPRDLGSGQDPIVRARAPGGVGPGERQA